MTTRYELDYALDNGNTVYYIFDNVSEKILSNTYTDFDIAERDCDDLNKSEEIELYNEFG